MHLVDDDDPYTDEALGLGRVERYVAAARAAGVDEIGFTDHVSRFAQASGWFDHPVWQADAVADLGAYHAAVAAAGDAGLPVKVGLEVDYLAGAEEAIRATVAGYDWDYLLGSVHWVSGLAVDWEQASIWERMEVADVWSRYADAVSAAALSGIYDSMAHPDLAKVFGHRPEQRPSHLYEGIADAFAAAGVCAEVSTAGIRNTPFAELYPDPLLLDMLHARGVPVTLASDAHCPADVGRDFDRARAALHEAGYRTITRFDRRERRQVAFA